ncbi:TetR family transcriptional regulator [Orbus sasakiae]|uniref:TetR family transcriptional regulator n=1 Tax=Orbus sasakiae TaxID=1078475 RepID=UPI0031E810E9
MRYLKKTDRYNEILNTAIHILIDEGIASITARKIAAHANISVGQIHHHFKSVGQLKAQALLNVTEQVIEKAELANSNQTIIEKIVNLVSPLEGHGGLVLRTLWNEAVFLAERDADIKLAYKESTLKWHTTIITLITQANEDNILAVKAPSELAWRLIALSCGIDTLAIIDECKFDKTAIKDHIMAVLYNEKTLPSN